MNVTLIVLKIQFIILFVSRISKNHFRTKTKLFFN